MPHSAFPFVDDSTVERGENEKADLMYALAHAQNAGGLCSRADKQMFSINENRQYVLHIKNKKNIFLCLD